MNKLFTIFGVEVRLDKDHYSVRLGSCSRGFYALTAQKRRKNIKVLEELLKELNQNG